MPIQWQLARGAYRILAIPLSAGRQGGVWHGMETKIEVKKGGEWQVVYRTSMDVAPEKLRAIKAALADQSDIEDIRTVSTPTEHLNADPKKRPNFIVEGMQEGAWRTIDTADDPTEAASVAAAQEDMGGYEAVRVLKTIAMTKTSLAVTEVNPGLTQMWEGRYPKALSRERLIVAAVALILVATGLTTAKFFLSGQTGVPWAAASRGDPKAEVHETLGVEDIDPIMVTHGPALTLAAGRPTLLEGEWAPDGACGEGHTIFDDEALIETREDEYRVRRLIKGYSEKDENVVVLYEGGDTELIQMIDGGFIVIARGEDGSKVAYIPDEDQVVMRNCGTDDAAPKDKPGDQDQDMQAALPNRITPSP